MTQTRGLLKNYNPGSPFCELLNPREGTSSAFATILKRLEDLDATELKRRAALVEQELYMLGITFTVYSDKNAIDRTLPFDVIPRLVTAGEWQKIERGIQQRVATLNAFLDDIYNQQHILKDGSIPSDLVLSNPNYRPEIVGQKLKFGTYAHIVGIDIVRDEAGQLLVLEDNARTPSGVSYVLENRVMMARMFPELIDKIPLRPVGDYGQHLQEAMAQLAPEGIEDPQVVLLSPGVYNSAYFEHVFLAREMGAILVEGPDLVVENDRVYMRTTDGLAPVHVIYRRVNDDFLDPEVFRPDSALGVKGLMRAWRAGNVAIANAVGTGVADDKAVFAYMPKLIRYYLQQEPILDQVPSYLCREKSGLDHALAHLPELVVKPVGESGGYGMIIGPTASKDELATFRDKLKQDPSNYIAQPTINLSVCPTMTEKGIEPRHVDLRPFAITAKETWVLPGGLTRVALRENSLVVNSSQGGGSKDTWVLSE